VDQTGAVVAPKSFKGGVFEHLQDDMVDGTYVDHVVCEKDPYYNGEDAGKDAKSQGKSSPTGSTPTSMSDRPSYSDAAFPDGVTKIISTFEVCAVCKDDGKILDCVTWTYTRTKGAPGKGAIADATGVSTPSTAFSNAKAKYEDNHGMGTRCPEARAATTPGPDVNPAGGAKKLPLDPPIAGSPFEVQWDVVNSSLDPVGNVPWQAWLDGHPHAAGVVPLIEGLDYQTVTFIVPGLSPGPHSLLLGVDPMNAIPETDETNNEQWDAFEVRDPTGIRTESGPRFGLLAAGPNTRRGEISITFALASNEPARLDVVDVQGRLVLSRAVGAMGDGVHTVVFTRAADLGSGVYFARLAQEARRDALKFIHLR
jgi:hypothetical protein